MWSPQATLLKEERQDQKFRHRDLMSLVYPSGGLQPTGRQRFDTRQGDGKLGRYVALCEFLRFCMADNDSYPLSVYPEAV